jgi:cytochrome b6-f complex iron-sulfur subunit
MARGCGVVAACLTAPLWNLLAGCEAESDGAAAGPLTVKVAELPLNRRVRLEQDGRAVEVVRTAEGVTARSLLCTHQGCNVRWIEAEQIYLCPCHDGKFNAEGQPIYGPPREALRRLPVTLTPTEAVIGR